MDDDKIRDVLGRYQPVGPPEGLRERTLVPAPTAPRTWPWAAAAAAVLAATVGLHAATNRALAGMVIPVPEVSVDALTAAMGGDEDARRAARLIVVERELRASLAGADATRTIEEVLNHVN